MRDDDVWGYLDRLRHMLINQLQIGLGKPIFDLNIAPIDPPQIAHSQPECLTRPTASGSFSPMASSTLTRSTCCDPCAHAASGDATAALPRRLIKSRRCMCRRQDHAFCSAKA